MDVESIFAKALSLASADERDAFLDDACADDGQLRQEVDELLAAHAAAGGFLEQTPVEFELPHTETGEVEPADPAETMGTRTTPVPSSPIRYFGEYELLDEIARGGMGVVYRARQSRLNRIVAVKMILAGRLASEDDIRRFHAEAEAAAKLDHPNIVPIYEIGEHAGQHYFSMAYVPGESLADRLRDQPLEPVEAAALLVEIAEAVAYAHRRGVIHRDLKPANILLEAADDDGPDAISAGSQSQRFAGGRPRITDFGLARMTQADESLTATGQILGTPAFMAPEQAAAESRQIGPAADVYSLGALLYTALTGRPPFQSATLAVLLRQVIDHEPLSPRQVNPAVPRDLDTICMKCLSKVPARRYESAEALANDLRRFLGNEPIRARRTGPIRRAVKTLRRHPLTSALIAVVVLMAAGGFAAVTSLWQEAEHERQIGERLLYRNNIALAGQTRETGILDQADRLLEECPPELREWEWHYMKRQCHPLQWHAEWPVSREHGESVGISFSPDGQRIAAAVGDSSIHVFDAAAGTELQTIEASDRVKWLALRDDVLVVVTGSHFRGEGDQLQVIEQPSGTVVRTFPWRRHSAVSRDGSRFAWPDSKTDTVTVWDPLKDEPVKVIPGIDTNWLALPANDSLLYLSNNTIVSFNLETAAERELKSLSNRDWTGFSDDGLIGAADDGLYQLQSGRRLCELETPPPNGDRRQCRFTRDGRHVIAACMNYWLRVYDAETGRQKLAIQRSELGLGTRVALSPDGRRLAAIGETSGADDKPTATLSLWDTVFIEPHFRRKEEQLALTSVELSFDGRYAASTGHIPIHFPVDAPWPGITKVYDTWTGRDVFTLDGRPEMSCMAISDDAQLVAAGDFGNAARIWNVRTRDVQHVLPSASGPVRSVVFDRPGERIAVGDESGRVVIYNSDDGELLLTLNDFEHAVESIAFSPDGELVAAATASTSRPQTRVWDASTGSIRFVLDGGISVAFANDSVQLAFVQRVDKFDGFFSGQQAVLKSLETGEVIRSFGEPAKSIAQLVWSRDGSRLAVHEQPAGEEPRTVFYDAMTGEGHVRPRGNRSGSPPLTLNADGSQLGQLSPRYKVPSVWAWDNTVLMPSRLRDHGAVVAIHFAGESDTVAVAYADGTIQVDPGTTLHAADAAAHIARWSPTDHRLATACHDGNLRLWHPDESEPLCVLSGLSGRVSDVKWSPDGKLIAAADGEAAIVWNADSGDIIQHIRIPILVLDWDSEGSRLVTAGREGVVIRDAATGKIERHLREGPWRRSVGHIDEVFVSWSPNGQWVAVAHDAKGGLSRWGVQLRRVGPIRVWNVATGQEVEWPQDPPRIPAGTMAWSPDGNSLASLLPTTVPGEPAADGSPRFRSVECTAVWNLQTGECQVSDGYHEYQASSLAMSPNGRRIATAAADKTIRLWDMTTGQETLILRPFDDWVLDIDFSGNGDQLGAVSLSGGTAVFDATPQ